MDEREIKRFLNKLDSGEATDKEKRAARRETARISEWLTTPAGREFLFGSVAADILEACREDWLEHAEAFAQAFSIECGGLPDEKERVLVSLLMDFAKRGFSALAAPTRAERRVSGAVFAEESREKRAAKLGPEIEERRGWIRAQYDVVRVGFPPGARGDKQARKVVIAKRRKACGEKLLDRTVRRDLAATRE